MPRPLKALAPHTIMKASQRIIHDLAARAAGLEHSALDTDGISERLLVDDAEGRPRERDGRGARRFVAADLATVLIFLPQCEGDGAHSKAANHRTFAAISCQQSQNTHS